VTSRFALALAVRPHALRPAAPGLTSAFFNLTNILDSTCYSSQPPFRERRISAALAEFLECPSWLVRDIPTVDEIRLLKDLDPSTLVGKLTSFPTSRMRQPITVASTQEYQCQGYAKRGASAETIGYVAKHRNPPVSPSSNQHPRQPQPQFQLSARSALLGYLIRAVSQMEVLWPLAVSVGSPEVVSVMRPADFNSGMPFLTVFALPTLIFN
jgi:hypothetical protein